MRFLFRSWLALMLAVLLVTGCSGTSPLVGVWSGTAKMGQSSNPMAGMAGAMLGMAMNGSCTLTLKADGTGFLKVPVAPERAIAWSEEDGKVILRPRAEDAAAASKPAQPGAGGSGSVVGTLSDDKKSLSVDLGLLKIDLTKQADAK